MAKKEAATPEAEPSTPPIVAGPPQGITPRPFFTIDGKFRDESGNIAPYVEPERGGRRVMHNIFGKAKGIQMLDPHAFKVQKTLPSGKVVEDDPYLALPKEGGGVEIRQVRADHAAEMLTCEVLTGGPTIHRLATADEIKAHKHVHHRGHAAEGGSHGNLNTVVNADDIA